MAYMPKLSITGYAKIERGETDVKLIRLEQICKVLNVDLTALLELSSNSIDSKSMDNNIQFKETLIEGILAKHQKKEKEIVHLKEIINKLTISK